MVARVRGLSPTSRRLKPPGEARAHPSQPSALDHSTIYGILVSSFDGSGRRSCVRLHRRMLDPTDKWTARIPAGSHSPSSTVHRLIRPSAGGVRASIADEEIAVWLATLITSAHASAHPARGDRTIPKPHQRRPPKTGPVSETLTTLSKDSSRGDGDSSPFHCQALFCLGGSPVPGLCDSVMRAHGTTVSIVRLRRRSARCRLS
jgi:hypothetical protein